MQILVAASRQLIDERLDHVSVQLPQSDVTQSRANVVLYLVQVKNEGVAAHLLLETPSFLAPSLIFVESLAEGATGCWHVRLRSMRSLKRKSSSSASSSCSRLSAAACRR